jgi:hypothetical protein
MKKKFREEEFDDDEIAADIKKEIEFELSKSQTPKTKKIIKILQWLLVPT